MTTEDWKDLTPTAYWQRVEAMFAFCEGVPTEQLQAGSLGELVEALKEAMEWNWLDGDMPINVIDQCDKALTPFKGGNDEA